MGPAISPISLKSPAWKVKLSLCRICLFTKREFFPLWGSGPSSPKDLEPTALLSPRICSRQPAVAGARRDLDYRRLKLSYRARSGQVLTGRRSPASFFYSTLLATSHPTCSNTQPLFLTVGVKSLHYAHRQPPTLVMSQLAGRGRPIDDGFRQRAREHVILLPGLAFRPFQS